MQQRLLKSISTSFIGFDAQLLKKYFDGRTNLLFCNFKRLMCSTLTISNTKMIIYSFNYYIVNLKPIV